MKKNHESYLSGKESEENGNNRKNTIIILIYSVLLFSVFFGCTEENTSKSSAYEHEAEVLTEEACINFAEQLHQSFADSNAQFLTNYIDWENISSTVCHGEAIRKEILDTLLKYYKVSTDFINMTYDDAEVRFITYYEENEIHHIIFRVFSLPQSIDFYDFSIKGNSKSIQVTDICNFYISGSMINSLKNEVDFWESKEDWYSSYSSLQLKELEVLQHIQSGDLKSAFVAFNETKEEWSELLRYRQLYGKICELSGNTPMLLGYLESELSRIPFNEKRRWLPRFYMNSISGNYADALIDVSNLKTEVGEDSYLSFLEGNIHFELGDYEQAINKFNASISNDPLVLVSHLGKTHSFLELHKYTEAVESLLVMEDNLALSSKSLEIEFAAYPDFINSSEFIQLKERLDTLLVE